MNQLLDQLFGLGKSLTFGGEGVEFRFAREFPAWAWVGVIAACFGIAGWSYWRLLGGRASRIALAAMRALVLVLVAILVAGPELVKQNERVERDWVVVMADRSASMTVADVGKDTGDPSPKTRESQLVETVRRAADTFTTLQQTRNVLFMGFDAGAFDLRFEKADRGVPASVELGKAQGRRTFIGQSLEQALRRVAGRPVAGVVMLTDGRSADATPRAVLRQLEARHIPVFPVPLGSAKALADLAVTHVESPSAAFIGDIVPVTVTVANLGAAKDAPFPKGKVQLVDSLTNAVLDERPLHEAPSADDGDQITLMAKPDQAGNATWSVRIVSDEPDLTADNNVSSFRVELADRPIRVVYFDGYPRWEYRYVKNILIREKSIRSSALLLASDRRYIQDGSEVLDSIPRTQEGWSGFDVVLMGDLRPELFSTEQLAQIKRLVAERGAGLLWIGGSGATPGAWRGTPLADLLPFTLKNGGSTSEAGPQPWMGPVLIKPGTAAARYGVLQLSTNADKPWPVELADPNLGWPLMRWAQRIEPASLKPTAEVLAIAQPQEGADSASPAPLVLTMRYGAGRVVYVGTDETWRYRYARGEVLTERFWIPLVRLLARDSLGRAGKPAILAVSPDTAQANQQVQVTVRLIDQTLIDKRPASIKVRVARKTGPDQPEQGRATELTLLPQGGGDADTPAAAFTGAWLGSEPGVFTIDSADPVLAGLDLSAQVEVILPDDELRFPQTDHASLAGLASATGGAVVPPERISDLPSLLPNREVRILGTPQTETLWDKPVVWVLLMTLLIVEWAGRRMIKLS
ncbi:MAG: hypothetical protein JSR77_10225 [Planctomycetes bacterium]|nr:hypothetical protein [Planctomycetota bacterium]